MKFNVTQGLIMVGLVMSLAACGPKLQSISDNQDQTDPEAAKREPVVVNINIAEKNAGFRLANATSYIMSLEGCASGLTVSNITQANANVQVYKYDQGCKIKLNSFVMNGITYVPTAGDPFTSWVAGDIATFAEAGQPANNFTVIVGTQLNNPITGIEAVSYTFTQLAIGTDETIANSVVGDSHALSVSGQDAPTLDIKGVIMTGMTAAGAGQFVFKIECDTVITGTSPDFACGSSTITTLKYVLVKDTYSSILTAAQAAALFLGTEPTIATGDLLPVGTSGALKGGFNTQNLTGPDGMHTSPNMIFVVKSGASFKYFNVDVTTLTYP